MMERIEIDPKICDGKPVIRGTRIPVAVILDCLASGESWDEILHGYPELTRDDIINALLYARVLLEHTDILPLAL